MAVARITIQPGARFPWHTHPGPVLVTVVSGEIIYVMADDCVQRSYVAGTGFVDHGHGMIHSAMNPTDGETVIIATFLEATADGPLTITEGIAGPADDCGLAAGLRRGSEAETGHGDMSLSDVDIQAIKARQQGTWASGDYAVIGTTLQITGELLCEAVDIAAGERVLDVAAGNGNAALAAARRGGEVTACDYVPALLETSAGTGRR